MLRSLGHEVSAAGVARIYAGLVDGMVIDRVDEGGEVRISALGMRVLTTDAVMRNEAGRERLAREVLGLCSGLGAR
jgi:LPPG:FO 2-phospho-L-lactate transferase